MLNFSVMACTLISTIPLIELSNLFNLLGVLHVGNLVSGKNNHFAIAPDSDRIS